MEISKNKWLEAQKNELKFWDNSKHSPNGVTGFVRSELNILGLDLDYFLKKKIVEIGCSVFGPINFIQAKEKFGVDPLINQFKKNPSFPKSDVVFINKCGEKTGFKSNYFDAVICTNVLDHCQNPIDVLREARRILKKDGILILECHFVKFNNPLINLLIKKNDPNHPHHFQLSELKNMLKTAKLRPDCEKIFTFRWKSRSPLKRLIRKIYFGQYYAIAKK